MKQRPRAANATAAATELRVLVGQFKRRFREKFNLGDLTSSQIAVLRRLHTDGPATVTGLAHAEGMRPQSMGATIAAVEVAGLVDGAPDPNDGRQTIWSLTAVSKEKIKVGRIACDDWLLEAIQENLSAEEQLELEKAIELLKRAYPIQDVLARYGIALPGASLHRMARCPFHADTHPSMGVFLDTNRFFCFRCGAKQVWTPRHSFGCREELV